DKHASLTIETTAEQERAILDGIKAISQSAPNYDPPGLTHNTLGGESTCVTQSENLLKKGSLDFSGRTPAAMWEGAFNRYASKQEKDNLVVTGTYGPNPSATFGTEGLAKTRLGKEYGNDPRGQGRRYDPSAVNSHTKTFFKDGNVVNRIQY